MQAIEVASAEQQSRKKQKKAVDCPQAIDVESEEFSGLTVDLTTTNSDEAASQVLDLTASDAVFAAQLQRALNSSTFQIPEVQFGGVGGVIIPEVSFSGTVQPPDILRPYRESIRSFLGNQAASDSLHVGEVFDNPHSLPGTPLYEGFASAYEKVRDKAIKLVFHGTPEKNIVAICRDGLDQKMRGKGTGQAHGKGEYFAENASMSLSYCK
jgi:hypothetical protein